MIEKIPFMDLQSEIAPIRSEVNDAINRVINAGWFILGPELEKFEQEFADYCGTNYCVGVGSGTDALYLSLMALGIGPGDEVITVSHTFIATALAITYTGATPVLVDIDPLTLTINPESIVNAITSKTKAIIPVHLYGQMSDMNSIMKISKEYNLFVIEDACQSHGATNNGKKAGSFGIIGCYSFYPSKNLGAFGDGGALVTNDGSLYQKLRLLRNYGQTKKYFHSNIGFNSRLDEIQAAILRVKLKYLDESNKKRENIATRYNNLREMDEITIPNVGENNTHVYHIYTIGTEKRDELKLFLDENKIETLVHYPIPVHLQEIYNNFPIITHSMAVTEEKAGQVLSLPMYSSLSSIQVQKVINCIKDFF